jgi:hypothetical protein
MKHQVVILGITLCLDLVSVARRTDGQNATTPILHYGGGKTDFIDSELAGAQIWFDATARNGASVRGRPLGQR